MFIDQSIAMVASPDPELPARPPAAPSSPFIGRQRELTTVIRLLAATRLLTLTGAGGSGKTRLASEAVGRIGGERPAVWIDLAALTEPDQVIQAVAVAFGMVEQSPAAALTLLRTEIGSRPLLLVLDNCEHLVDACAELAESLLRACPNLTVLATSREALGVAAETAWLVPPLEMAEAMELFADRARAVLPSFAITPGNGRAVLEICQRLDGIPLAIELAAARVKVLSPEQIAERLGGALRLLSAGTRSTIPRHRTLRGTLDWSHALLSPAEQVLLRRLAVFTGGFTLEAAEGVAGFEPLEPFDLLDTLAGLVDKSLVVLEASGADARYRLLETVRQYGDLKLAEADEVELVSRRHAEHFVGMAEAIAPSIFGGLSDPKWVAILDPEIPNFRAAAEWMARSDDRIELALRLTWALHWFWWSRGPFEEVRRLAVLLERPVEVAPVVRIRATVALAHFNVWQGRFEDSTRYSTRALEQLEGVDAPELLAYGLILRGAVKAITGQPSAALMDLTRAVPIARAHSAGTVLAGIGLHFQGYCLLASGDPEGSAVCFEEELAICAAAGHAPGTGHALTALGELAFATGRRDEALKSFLVSLDRHLTVTDGWGIAKCIEGIAACCTHANPDRAARLYGAAEALRERIAHSLWEPERQFQEPLIAYLRSVLGSRFAALWAEGRSLGRDAVIALARESEEIVVVPTPEPVLAPTPVAAAAAGGRSDLEVRSLGRLELAVGGRPIDSTAWGSARSRELLLFLLVHRDGATKERIGAEFWRDASPAQRRNTFHVTLHRLRKALGHPEWVVVENDRYRLDPQLVVDFDAVRFEAEVIPATRDLGRGRPGAATALAAALDRYQGPFLDGESVGDWSLEIRDRLERLFVDGGLAYARWLMAEERPAEADAVCLRVIGRDSLNEEAWRLRMTSHARRGERPQAIRLYQQLTALLAQEMDDEPDERTAELFEQILAGADV